MVNKIFWLTGESGAGKTTLAIPLAKELNAVLLDGNEMRGSISVNIGFSKEERAEHNYKVARLANILSKQMNVVVSVIAPSKEVREKIDKICSPIWIYGFSVMVMLGIFSLLFSIVCSILLFYFIRNSQSNEEAKK